MRGLLDSLIRSLSSGEAVDPLSDVLAVARSEAHALLSKHEWRGVHKVPSMSSPGYEEKFCTMDDFRLLCDHLGVEIKDTPARREVVKKDKG